MINKNLKILITGGAGYIGSLLTANLVQQGYRVTVIDNLLFNQATLLSLCSYKDFEFIKADISNFEILNSIIPKHDVIMPLAAIVGAPACNKDLSLAKLINLDSHMNIVNNISSNQMVIFPNTNSGYGVGENEELCTEESILQPISFYGKAKVEIEKAFLEKGNAITFRIATVFGMSPRMRIDLLVNDFVYRAVNDRSLVLFEENFKRNFVHIKDVVKAFAFGIENYEIMKGEPYNVGLSTANLTKKKLAEKIKEYLPNLYIHSAEIGEDPDKRDYVVSNKKIESLGWKADYSLDDGIKELIKGYKIIKLYNYRNV